MEQIISKYDTYKSMLQKDITQWYVFLAILLILCVVLLFVFLSWKRAIDCAMSTKKGKCRNKQTGKINSSIAEWFFSIVMAFIIFLFTFISIVQHISKRRYDIQNEAFIIHDSGYSVVVKSESVGRNIHSERYYISFYNGVETIEISASYVIYAEFLQEESTHDDIAFIYSEKSKVLLDMWKK